MKKNSNIRVPSAVSSRFGFGGYQDQASRFWMSDSFDFENRGEERLDITKLAATQRAIGNFVNIVTGKQIPVVFNKRGGDSYTDGEKVVIGTKLDGKNFDPAVGLALHEGSHIAYTDFSLFKSLGGYSVQALSDTRMANIVRLNGLDPDLTMTESDFGIIKDLLNWIEDRRIDYIIYRNAPGYRMYYEAMYDKYFNDKIIDKALLKNSKNQEDYDCYMFHIINFTNANRNLNALKRLREIWNLIDLKNISRLRDTAQALQVACEVFRIMRSAVGTQPSPTPNNANTDQNAVASPGDGDGSAASQDDQQDDFDQFDSDASVADHADQLLSAREQEKLENAIKRQKSFLGGDVKRDGSLSKQDSALVEAVRESGTEVVNVATGAGKAGIISTVVIKKLTASIICSIPELFRRDAVSAINGQINLNSDSHAAIRLNRQQDVVMKGILLGKQLGSKLQIRNADRTLKTTRLQNGKIDRRLVSQLGYDNANVFHKIVTDKYKNYLIHISIDASGSMGGNKFNKALISAIAIAQAASMTTGIRVQISLRGTSNHFGKGDRCVTIVAYDSATDKISKIKNYFKYLDVFGCTPEGVAFKSIESIIRADGKGDEIIFINYSDGAPTYVDGMQMGPEEFTKKTIGEFRELNFNVISYFIYEYSVCDSTKKVFSTMYGADAKFIQPDSMIEVAKTMNQKFLEIEK